MKNKTFHLILFSLQGMVMAIPFLETDFILHKIHGFRDTAQGSMLWPGLCVRFMPLHMIRVPKKHTNW